MCGKWSEEGIWLLVIIRETIQSINVQDVRPNKVPLLRGGGPEPGLLPPVGKVPGGTGTEVSDVALRSTRETKLRFVALPTSSRVWLNSLWILVASSLTSTAGSSLASLATVLTRRGIRTTLSRWPARESKTVLVIRRRLSRTTAFPPRPSRSTIRLKNAGWTASLEATTLDVRKSWKG